GLQAQSDFLMKVSESSRLGRFCYEAVKVVGTCRALRPDALGLAYQSLVLGEIQGRLPASGTLVRLGDRPGKTKLASKYREVRRIVEALRAWTTDAAAIAIDSAPLTVRTLPSSASSPTVAKSLSCSGSSCPVATSRPSAMQSCPFAPSVSSGASWVA